MFGKKPKEPKHNITSPTAEGSENPAWDFLVLISIILTTPFIFIYSLFTGRIRNPFIVVAFLIAVMTGLFYLSKSGVVSSKHIKSKIIQQTLEELTPEEKEELRSEISTLRESIDVNKFPVPLSPILDVPMDMLSINYLLFMLQSGYIHPNGAGSEFILDSYLHSKHKLLKQKSWEALQNIQTEEAVRTLKNYEAEVAKRNEQLKKEYGKLRPENESIQDYSNDIANKIKDLRN